MVFSMPSRTSTTPESFLIASPTFGAHVFSSAGSCENSLMAIGSGDAGQVADHVLQQLDELHVEHRIAFVDLLAHLRDHLVAGARSRLRFSFTAMSPVFASVTAASPSCRPVRRDVLSTSGVARRDLLDAA
mgnify:CR=1 FL=1